MSEFPGHCSHRQVKREQGRQAICEDCGRPIFLACGPCNHEFKSWATDRRYERCIYCAAVRRVQSATNQP